MLDGRPTQSLRVLYFIGSYGPEVIGNASHEQTVLAMLARGHHVDVFTQITEPGTSLYTKARYSGVDVYQVNLAGRSNLGGLARPLAARLLQYEYLPLLVRALRRHLRSRRYDILHVEGAYPFGLAAVLGGGRTPILLNVQGADVIRLPEADYGYRRYLMPRAAAKLVFLRSALVRAISQFLADYIVAEGLAAPERIEVVHRAIEQEAFPPAATDLSEFRRESRLELANKYGLGLDRPVVITLSRLHPFKGLEYLVDAIPQVVRECRTIERPVPWFLVCGPSRSTPHFGDYREFLLERASRLGVAQHIVFTGQVAHENVREHLAGANTLVCPSIFEAQNKVVPEACAVGTPSVVTTTTGIASYLVPKGACVPVAPKDAGEIARALLGLLNSNDLYASVQKRALMAAETLRAEVLAPQLERVWYRAAGKLIGPD